MKKFVYLCLFSFINLILFSCSNVLLENPEYGALKLQLPSVGTSRAAENIDSLEFDILIKNRDTGTEKSEKIKSDKNFTVELEAGFYTIQISAYEPAAPEDILYAGEVSDVEVVAGKTTSTSIALKSIDNNEVIGRNGTIRLSKISNRVVLKHNKWGEKDFSELQSDTIDLTKYYNDKLPVAGQTLKIYYKGTINIDANKLYMNLVDIATFEDGHVEWHAIVPVEKIHIPVATNVKANQEFEINVSFTLEADVKHTLQVAFGCGAEGRIYNPVKVEIEGDIIKVTPPDEIYLAPLIENGCDGYCIGVCSGKTPEGWDNWIWGRKIHLTDKNVFQDIDFGMDFDETRIENGKIYPVIDFYKDVDLDVGERTWLSKETGEEVSYVPGVHPLSLEGRRFGSNNYYTQAYENTIIWEKGSYYGHCGWNLSGIDLSEYDRIRIEIESTETHVKIAMNDTEYKNYHCFDYEIDDNIFEADLTGKGATWIDSDGGPLDKSKGLIIFLDAYIDSKEPRETDLKTVVKSVQLLKGTEHKNSQLDLAGAYFVPFDDCRTYDEGIIEWHKGDSSAGWNVKYTDLSAYSKVQIETETEGENLAKVRIRLKLSNGVDVYYFLDGECGNGTFVGKLDGTPLGTTLYFKGYEEIDEKQALAEENISLVFIEIVCENTTKEGQKTIVKSVQLLN